VEPRGIEPLTFALRTRLSRAFQGLTLRRKSRQPGLCRVGMASGTALPIPPCMIAAIFSDARFATARTGSSFKCAVPLGGAGLAVPEHLADEVVAVAARHGDGGEAVPKVVNSEIVEPGGPPGGAAKAFGCRRNQAGRTYGLPSWCGSSAGPEAVPLWDTPGYCQLGRPSAQPIRGSLVPPAGVIGPAADGSSALLEQSSGVVPVPIEESFCVYLSLSFRRRSPRVVVPMWYLPGLRGFLCPS
jgi:hypothetical protein